MAEGISATEKKGTEMPRKEAYSAFKKGGWEGLIEKVPAQQMRKLCENREKSPQRIEGTALGAHVGAANGACLRRPGQNPSCRCDWAFIRQEGAWPERILGITSQRLQNWMKMIKLTDSRTSMTPKHRKCGTTTQGHIVTQLLRISDK